MEQQEYLMRFHIMPKCTILAVVFAVLLLSVSGWGSCSSGWQQSGPSQQYSLTCVVGTCSFSPGSCSAKEMCNALRAGAECAETYQRDGYYWTGVFKGQGRIEYSTGYYNCSESSNLCISQTSLQYGLVGCYYSIRCTNECEADSLACVSSGKTWIPGSDGQCGECRTTDCSQCNAFRGACEAEGGRFSASCLTTNGETCCQGVCDVCSGEAMKNLYRMKVKMCCDQGLAPPDFAQVCYTRGIGQQCGVEWSKYFELSSGEWACQSPGLSVDAAIRYRELCFEQTSSSSEGSSSSGEGGSSGGEGGSSSSGEGGSSGASPYPEGCDECPWLDSILDTLKAQKDIVSDIYSCLTVPGLCAGNEEIQIDTSILPYIRPFMDSSLKLDSNQIKALKELDTNVLKLLAVDSIRMKLDSMKLDSDSLTRKLISGGVALVDSTVDAMNDSTRKWLRRIADSLGVTADSLAAHIDSIVSHIPDTVLDSILKYQKSAIDNFDSAFWRADSGFAKVDNLTDSAIKYFKEGYKFDSIYNVQYRDSLGVIHNAISDIGINIAYGLGYGDTASSTLRGDLGGIKGAIDGLNGKFDPAAVDTGAVGFGNGWGEHGDRLADSIALEIGWKGGLDTVNIDSVFRHSTWDDISAIDSVNDYVDDTLGGILDSLHALLKRENDSIKGSLSDSLTVWADSFVKVSPFVSFDSLIYSTIGAKIPNSDQCPEDCQRWSLNLPRFGLINYTVDFGLCLGRAPLAGLNVLGFLRLIIRLVIVWSCISIVMWNFSQRKM